MAQSAFYEESAISLRGKTEARFYTVFHITGIVFFAIAALLLLLSFVQVPNIIGKAENGTDLALSLIFWFALIALLVLVGLLFWRVKRRFNVSYDYTFVEDELRITKVFNGRKRKALNTLKADQILKIGYCEKDSYSDTLQSVGGKPIFVTPNSDPAEGKDFIYIYYTSSEGKFVYVLECRKALLEYLVKAAGITKFTKQ